MYSNCKEAVVYRDYLFERFKEMYSDLENRNIVIFGTGSYGHAMYNLLKEAGIGKIVAFSDEGYKWDEEIIDGIVCVNNKHEMLFDSSNAIVVALWPKKEIGEDLSLRYGGKNVYTLSYESGLIEDKLIEYELEFCVDCNNDFLKIYNYSDNKDSVNEKLKCLNSYLGDDVSRMVVENYTRILFSGDIGLLIEYLIRSQIILMNGIILWMDLMKKRFLLIAGLMMVIR